MVTYIRQAILLGREVVLVTLTKHRIAEFDLEDTKRLTVYLLDKGIDRIHAGAAEVGAVQVDPGLTALGFSASHLHRPILVYHFPRRAPTLSLKLCMGIQPVSLSRAER